MSLTDDAMAETARLLKENQELRAERDGARELACVALDILRNVSDLPVRELFGVDGLDELPGWFTGYGKPQAEGKRQ